ncbi:MAG: hypothetical protein QF561_06920 [Phycisphaerales bacterium]|nr:hypothetical protein [Phycisphaerales bacterium]
MPEQPPPLLPYSAIVALVILLGMIGIAIAMLLSRRLRRPGRPAPRHEGPDPWLESGRRIDAGDEQADRDH